MAVRLRERGDGSVYSQARFRYAGQETSVSFDDHAEALKFDPLVTQVGLGKSMEIYRIVSTPTRATSVRQVLDKHNDTLTGVEPGTIARYRSYAGNDIGPPSATSRWKPCRVRTSKAGSSR